VRETKGSYGSGHQHVAITTMWNDYSTSTHFYVQKAVDAVASNVKKEHAPHKQ
jgi:hypothetical protein